MFVVFSQFYETHLQKLPPPKKKRIWNQNYNEQSEQIWNV